MTKPSKNYGFVRCDSEFEAIGQDLDMSTIDRYGYTLFRMSCLMPSFMTVEIPSVSNDDSAYPSVSGRVFSFLAGVILETFLRIRFAELVEPNTLLATAAQKPA